MIDSQGAPSLDINSLSVMSSLYPLIKVFEIANTIIFRFLHSFFLLFSFIKFFFSLYIFISLSLSIHPNLPSSPYLYLCQSLNLCISISFFSFSLFPSVYFFLYRSPLSFFYLVVLAPICKETWVKSVSWEYSCNEVYLEEFYEWKIFKSPYL